MIEIKIIDYNGCKKYPSICICITLLLLRIFKSNLTVNRHYHFFCNVVSREIKY